MPRLLETCMTSGGKVRIYELSRDLGLDNRDVLNAAESLAIAAKSHSSSISDAEAAKIRTHLAGKGAGGAAGKPAAKSSEGGNAILSVKKAAPSAPAAPQAAKPVAAPAPVAKPQAAAPAPRPQAPPARPAAPAAAKPSAPAAPHLQRPSRSLW